MTKNQLGIDASKGTSRFNGSLECANCHVAAQAKNILEKVEDFVMLNEYQIWLNDDPHSRAYLGIIPDQKHFNAVSERLKELNRAVNQAACNVPGSNGIIPTPAAVDLPNWGASNDLSLEIIKKVSSIKDKAPIENLFGQLIDQHDLLSNSDALSAHSPRLVSTVKQCMSCHAGWDLTQNEFDTEVVKYGTGVSCEGCHGASENWLAEHSQADWRKKDQKYKSEKNLYNVRQPVSKSKQCFSCHIGDVRRGRVVTHEMYAAGHPPLPSIETESFADQIPRHWRYLSEKKTDFKFAQQFNLNFSNDLSFGANIQMKEEFPRTKNLLVGGVMAAATSANLLADSAGEYASLKAGDTTNRQPWPEFAAFDCAACHHDLKAGVKDRGFAGVPGRPPATYWPRSLSKLGLAYLSVKENGDFVAEFTKSQKSLQAVLDRQPFGKPEELQATGREHSAFLEKVAGRIQSQPLTRTEAVTALKLLVGGFDQSAFNPRAETWDFHSARQMAWAINLIYCELHQPRNTGSRQLSDSFVNPDPDAAAVMQELRERLMLDLPTTGEITTQQEEYLKAWSNFDRKQFLELLEQLRQRVEKSDFTLPSNDDKRLKLGALEASTLHDFLVNTSSR